jgi:hypothetical protein
VAGVVLLLIVSLLETVLTLTALRELAAALKQGDRSKLRNMHGTVWGAPLLLPMWLALFVWCVVKLVTG